MNCYFWHSNNYCWICAGLPLLLTPKIICWQSFDTFLMRKQKTKNGPGKTGRPVLFILNVNALYISLLLWNKITGDAMRIHKRRSLHRVNLKSLNSLNARRTDMPKLMPCVFERISSRMPQQTTCEKKEISFPCTTSRNAAQRKWLTVTGRYMSGDFRLSCHCYYSNYEPFCKEVGFFYFIHNDGTQRNNLTTQSNVLNWDLK